MSRIDEGKKDLMIKVHVLTQFGVYLTDFDEGGVVVYMGMSLYRWLKLKRSKILIPLTKRFSS